LKGGSTNLLLQSSSDILASLSTFCSSLDKDSIIERLYRGQIVSGVYLTMKAHDSRVECDLVVDLVSASEESTLQPSKVNNGVDFEQVESLGKVAAAYGHQVRRKGAVPCFVAHYNLYAAVIAMLKTFDLFDEYSKVSEHSRLANYFGLLLSKMSH
jgi:hypothetical protein